MLLWMAQLPVGQSFTHSLTHSQQQRQKEQANGPAQLIHFFIHPPDSLPHSLAHSRVLITARCVCSFVSHAPSETCRYRRLESGRGNSHSAGQTQKSTLHCCSSSSKSKRSASKKMKSFPAMHLGSCLFVFRSAWPRLTLYFFSKRLCSSSQFFLLGGASVARCKRLAIVPSFFHVNQ